MVHTLCCKKGTLLTEASDKSLRCIGARQYFKTYARERATKGILAEIASPTYAKYTLNTWYDLADFADDPVLKHRMDMLLNLYWTDWAMEQIDGRPVDFAPKAVYNSPYLQGDFRGGRWPSAKEYKC